MSGKKGREAEDPAAYPPEKGTEGAGQASLGQTIPGPSTSGSSAAGPSTAPTQDDSAPPAYEASSRIGPTISAPFNFPSESDLPPYTPPTAESSTQKPIAIPQLTPDQGSPFLTAYPPSLLSHGVTQSTWQSFLDTISAFLTAKVSDRAVSHAGDMAKHIAKGPTTFGKNVFDHSKQVGQEIYADAKKGKVVEAATGIMVGAITVPLFTALGLVGTVANLPGSAIGAIVKKPKTPGQRAAAYATVANKNWLHGRGLHAQMFDTNELAQMLGIPVMDFLSLAKQTKDRSAAGQMQALESYIAPLEVEPGKIAMEFATNTIWLVIAEIVRQEGGNGEP